MVFHKTAIDVIAKGLDPRHPHKKLGTDGMLAVPTSSDKQGEVVQDLTTVVSISGSGATDETSVVQTPRNALVTLPEAPLPEEKVTIQQTTEPVVPKTGRRPPVRTPKVPQE